MDFIKTRDLGFNSENVLAIPFHDFRLLKSHDELKQRILQHPDVIDITSSSTLPFNRCGGAFGFWWEGKTPEQKSPNLNIFDIDYNYLDFYDIELVEGRNFSRDITTDKKRTYLLNETAVKVCGWETAVGKQFFSEKNPARVIGVVKDFHQGSFHGKIEPLAINLSPKSPPRELSLRLTGENRSEVLSYIKSFWNDYSIFPFEYYFLEDFIDNQYESDNRLFQIFTYSSILAIIIACMGLFGLVIFAINQRVKEIGIRKVLGASIRNITSSLTRSFIKWVIIANLFAWPLAYYFMQRWLQGFAYRTNLSPEVFLGGGFIALIIATLTISLLIFKAARANPVESLRHE